MLFTIFQGLWMGSRWISLVTRCLLLDLEGSSLFSASLPSTEDRRSALSLTLIATNSCVGQHISRWRRWHCGLGNREHNLGRLDRGHCCAPPYQVQVDCQELCKNFNLYSLPKKCKRISTHYLTWKALFSSNCFLQFLKQKAERGKWSFLLTLNGALAGMVSFYWSWLKNFFFIDSISVHCIECAKLYQKHSTLGPIVPLAIFLLHQH